MISIYNDNFTTPESRVPYCIEVYRCVEADHCRSKEYPVPSNKTEIEIVVPDLTNSYRDPMKKNFYKYLVYNHTSCKCGELEERKLYKAIHNNKVSEHDFKKKYKKNPPNLLRKRNYCNSPELRYKLHPYHLQVSPKFIYLAYEQCLPGCIAISNETFTKLTFITNSKSLNVSLTNDTSCVAYDTPSLPNPSSTSHTHSASKPSSHSTLPPSNLPSNTGRFLIF